MPTTYKLPGITAPVSGTQPIYNGSNFTWNEALKGMTRLPENERITTNIVKAARMMDEVRKFLGDKPISVTSWYRPVHVNQAVGGATQSTHILGIAVDFNVRGMKPSEVYQKLEPYWGARGGLASSNTFTHLDCRGYKARWRY